MEGVLYKWTNYISGWQPRWFVLAGGTLSYYDSQEDAWKGCKGSIKISVCEIQVHPSDFTRVDLTIPGEQYFYLKAINAAERQKWLVALGTAKACLTDNRTKREKELQENTEALKTKMCELRLYCDLLLEQVNKLKECPLGEETSASGEAGDDAGSLVKSTCTTFLKTLEECMQIAGRTFSPGLLSHGLSGSHSPPGSPALTAVKPQKIKSLNQTNPHPEEKQKRPVNSSASPSSQRSAEFGPGGQPTLSPPDNTVAPPTGNRLLEQESEDPAEARAAPQAPAESECAPAEAGTDVCPDKVAHAQEKQGDVESSCQEQRVSDRNEADPGVNELESQGKQDEEEQVETFFSSMSHRFSDIRLEDDNGIPTRAFLDSCYAIVPVLDKLGPTVFAPVKIDFVGNIKKVQQKLLSEPGTFPTLQSVVLHEVETKVAHVRNSATEALLWLKRGLKFLKEFLAELNGGEQDIHSALNNAYGKTLRQYHGWVVRGVFALALRAAPSYGGFMAALVSHEGDELREGFSASMHRDLAIYLPAMEKQLSILDALYEEYGLESDEVV
ncbi:pleckstrin homology domain-containing family A member 8 [Electrophorus electricus]|uniref:pleckstrin homology domain-containing family A member 8 n=1 Tax=Electrophorus electricus TaxID=8005 RepID=UPI0015D009B1|nr:pleckstrin homology domain-containing family A member 8 [Electrophorus electricus]